MGDRPPGVELVAVNGRRFPGLAAAVLVFIIDPATRRFLLLSSPSKRRRAGWEVVNGGVERAETLLEAVRREVAEEAGPAVRLRVLGTVHAWTYHYDEHVTHMLSIAYVASYLGGEVVPGDDMAGSEVRWATLAEIEADAAAGVAFVPEELWVFRRAVECFDLWSQHEEADAGVLP